MTETKDLYLHWDGIENKVDLFSVADVRYRETSFGEVESCINSNTGELVCAKVPDSEFDRVRSGVDAFNGASEYDLDEKSGS